MASIISLKGVTKLYGSGVVAAENMLKQGATKDKVYEATGVTTALYDVTLEIEKGEIFVIIGLSGSGKSTLVRCLNGLHLPSSGSIVVNNRRVEALSTKDLREFRRYEVAMVFQHFGLMDHRSVLANIAYGLEVRGVPKREREAKAEEMIDLVGLKGLGDKPISSLSGGMKQRVGIARGLANDPEVLLMDEPFSALDPLVRKDMQFELLSIQRKLGKTVVFITHDINEAFKLGDRVAIMRDGRVVQVDTPEVMIEEPADDYVREFIKNADRSHILTAKNIMITPRVVAKLSETTDEASQKMLQTNALGLCVVDDENRFLGSLSKKVATAHPNQLITLEMLDKHCKIREDTFIRELIQLAAEKSLPLGVISQDGHLSGIVTRGTILASFTE